MPRKPNYRYERSQRAKRKAAKKAARLETKARKAEETKARKAEDGNNGGVCLTSRSLPEAQMSR